MLFQIMLYDLDAMAASDLASSELARRPAVREAAARVGHILTLPLSRSFWGL